MEDQQRYHRHYILPQIGKEGQEKFRRSKVLIIGVGGLGCPVAMQLAAAGIGTIELVDYDVVEASNLQRQVLYTERDLGKPKAECAARRLKEMNSECEVLVYPWKLTQENCVQLFAEYDIIVDATDNFDTRYLISDACVELNKPHVYGAIYEFYGQVAILGGQGPCLRCLSDPERDPRQPISARKVGVLAPVPGVIGSLQACEVLKYIAGAGQCLTGSMIFLDMLTMQFDRVELSKNPRCPLCGNGGTQWKKN